MVYKAPKVEGQFLAFKKSALFSFSSAFSPVVKIKTSQFLCFFSLEKTCVISYHKVTALKPFVSVFEVTIVKSGTNDDVKSSCENDAKSVTYKLEQLKSTRHAYDGCRTRKKARKFLCMHAIL